MNLSQTAQYLVENLKPKGQINGCKFVSFRKSWDPDYADKLLISPILLRAIDVPALARAWHVPTDNVTFINLGNLSGLNFEGSTLLNADFQGINLSKSNFALAKGSPPPGRLGLRIMFSNLNDAKFTSSTMNYVVFTQSSFIRADFSKSKFKGAKLTKSDFSGANFNRADFSGADFSGSIGCGIKGKPLKLPTGVKLVGGCLKIN